MNHLHLFLKLVPKFEDRLRAKNDFLALSRAIYSDEKSLELMAYFEKNYNQYNKKDTLHWYTKGCFFYKVTNSCLRIATSDSIQYCRLIAGDIQRAIREHYKEKSKNFNGVLYRGAYLSETEWSNLKENRNKEIEIHGFLSVSNDINVAMNFLMRDTSKKILITILVPKGPIEEEQGFAEIEEFSEYKNEKEILFNARSRFTILETEDVHLQEFSYRHLVLLYGAQSFRKFVAEKSPVQKVSIGKMKDPLCALCQEKILEKSTKMFFASLGDHAKNIYFCQKCPPDVVMSSNAPLLCIPLLNHLSKKQKFNGYKINITGFMMKYPKRHELAIPLYGYQCCRCQAKKQLLYYKCTDCLQTNKV